SGLEAIATAAAKIATGQAEIVVAGGTESMSMVTFMGSTLSPNPYLMEHRPNTYLSMGLSVEGIAKEYGITREASDEIALQSHRKAIAAQDAGKFEAEIVPVQAVVKEGEGENVRVSEVLFSRDEGPRRETTAEALANLKTAFLPDGVITAG